MRNTILFAVAVLLSCLILKRKESAGHVNNVRPVPPGAEYYLTLEDSTFVIYSEDFKPLDTFLLRDNPKLDTFFFNDNQ